MSASVFTYNGDPLFPNSDSELKGSSSGQKSQHIRFTTGSLGGETRDLRHGCLHAACTLPSHCRHARFCCVYAVEIILPSSRARETLTFSPSISFYNDFGAVFSPAEPAGPILVCKKKRTSDSHSRSHSRHAICCCKNAGF